MRSPRIVVLLMLAVFTASASGFTESLAQAYHNAWSKCRHTQRRIARGKPCPCGCNKKAKPALRIKSDHADCDADDVVAHAPAFSQLDSLLSSEAPLTPTLSSVLSFITWLEMHSLPRPPLIKPG